MSPKKANSGTDVRLGHALEAITTAEAKLRALGAGGEADGLAQIKPAIATWGVKAGELMPIAADAPTDRLMVTFIVQELPEGKSECEENWVEIERIEFDATSYVLGLDLERIRYMWGDSGDAHFMAVELTGRAGAQGVTNADEAIERFFGVKSLDDITQDLLDAKRAEYGIEPNDNEGMKP